MGWPIAWNLTRPPALIAMAFLSFSALDGCEAPPPKQQPTIWHRNGVAVTASSEVFNDAGKTFVACAEADLARTPPDMHALYLASRQMFGLPQSATDCMIENGFKLERLRGQK